MLNQLLFPFHFENIYIFLSSTAYFSRALLLLSLHNMMALCCASFVTIFTHFFFSLSLLLYFSSSHHHSLHCLYNRRVPLLSQAVIREMSEFATCVVIGLIGMGHNDWCMFYDAAHLLDAQELHLPFYLSTVTLLTVLTLNVSVFQ